MKNAERSMNFSTCGSVSNLVYTFCNTVGLSRIKSYSYGELADHFQELTGITVACAYGDVNLPENAINIASLQRLIRRWVAKQP